MSSSQISLPEKAYFGGLQKTEIIQQAMVEDVEAQFSIEEINAYRPKGFWGLLRENAKGILFWLAIAAFVIIVGLMATGVIPEEEYECVGERCVPTRNRHVIDDLFSAAGNVVQDGGPVVV
ncbi:hypothetical protein N7466_004269 [Penicillium verhagenii]|uniref:uncharacterized protein n=1 Tax=Penicillium verhagenii TaxID=1562060 RepID=UPI002544E985|nr:uncharacterized protein N7466_004269 [Penicillium verhagenii]KAJ5934722.1 hypothetical protein N7466_004269 [Penicillium verhagenii]